jgi:hypothetical protein
MPKLLVLLPLEKAAIEFAYKPVPDELCPKQPIALDPT